MKTTVLLFFILAGWSLSAQTTITGKISDSKGRPVPGANIFIKDSYDGTSSDTSGSFSFNSFEQGEQILAVTFIGFEPYEEKVLLNGTTLTKNIKLKETVSALDVVVITAGAFEASDEKKAVVLKPLDIVTTAGADADISSALNKLPGTQQVGESEGLYVRGGAKYETTFIIDEMTVQNPYMSSVPDIPQRGRFSPFQFKGTVFSTGGYSAQYGQALSSAVILKSQDLAEKSFSSLGILPLAVSAGHLEAWEKTNAGIFASYSNLKPYFMIFPQRTQWEKEPESYGGTVTFRHKISPTGIIKMDGSYSHSLLALKYENIEDPGTTDKFQLNNDNIYFITSLREALTDKIGLFTGLSYAYNYDNIDFNQNKADGKNSLIQSKAMLTYDLGNYSLLRMGGEYHYKEGSNAYNQQLLEFSDNYSAVFAEADIFLSYRLAARVGGRFENSSLIGEQNFAPRTSFAYKTGEKSQVSVAYGHFYQTPQPERNELLYNFYLAAPELDYEKAIHYIANYQYLTDKITFRVEAYYKEYENLIKYHFNGLSAIDNEGFGFARGVDIFWRDKKTLKNSDYWISYSFLDTERLYRAFPEQATPSFASAHNLSIVYKRWISPIKTSFSGSYTFASGRPYYNPNSTEFMSDKAPAYHDLSLSASYITQIWGNFTVLYCSLGNILGIDNIYTYHYSNDGTQRVAVKAPARRTFMIGLFISFTEKEDNITN